MVEPKLTQRIWIELLKQLRERLRPVLRLLVPAEVPIHNLLALRGEAVFGQSEEPLVILSQIPLFVTLF